MQEGTSYGFWKSVTGNDVPPQPVDWMENRVVDATRLMKPLIIFAFGSIGFIIPVIVIVFVPFFSDDPSSYGQIVLIFSLLLGLPLGAGFAYLGWRAMRDTAAPGVGLGRDGLAIRNKKGQVRWVPFDKISSISRLYYSGKGESLVTFEAKSYAGIDTLLVSKEIAVALSTRLEESGYSVAPQGTVAKIKK